MAWWELFLSDRGGISPRSPPPPPSRQTRSKIWCTSAACLKEQNKHKLVHAGCSFMKMCKVVLKKRWSCFTVMCDPDFSRALRLRRRLSLLLWIHKGSGLCSNVCYRNNVIYMYGKKWSHLLFLCVSLSFPSLWSALPHSQFQFIIRKPDEFAPPLRLSSLLHSAENCFNLHLSIANPLLSIYQSTVHPPPALDLTKTIQAATPLLSELTPISTQMWNKAVTL